MTLRRLIVNGDDFGISQEVNEAVIFAFRHGILTSTSLMVSGEAFEQAVALAKESPGLAVGLHVTCASGRPVLPPARLTHVVGKEGCFPADPGLAGLNYFFSRAARKEITKEIAAQFENFARSGLEFSHVDSHCHLHVHPVVLDAMVEIAQSYGIKRIRVPADNFFSALPFLRSSVKSGAYAIIFKLLTQRMKRILPPRGFIFPKTVYGNLLSGKMSLQYVLWLLDNLQEGTSELYLHPAMPREADRKIDARRLQRFTEFSILIHPEVREKIARSQISLSTYHDLEKQI
ncbi:MAG: hopanoid biosynthesis-associated protein HpnK [Syntrophobacteraceae bacterium]